MMGLQTIYRGPMPNKKHTEYLIRKFATERKNLFLSHVNMYHQSFVESTILIFRSRRLFVFSGDYGLDDP
jgi:hypothetical protein